MKQTESRPSCSIRFDSIRFDRFDSNTWISTQSSPKQVKLKLCLILIQTEINSNSIQIQSKFDYGDSKKNAIQFKSKFNSIRSKMQFNSNQNAIQFKSKCSSIQIEMQLNSKQNAIQFKSKCNSISMQNLPLRCCSQFVTMESLVQLELIRQSLIINKKIKHNKREMKK